MGIRQTLYIVSDSRILTSSLCLFYHVSLFLRQVSYSIKLYIVSLLFRVYCSICLEDALFLLLSMTHMWLTSLTVPCSNNIEQICQFEDNAVMIGTREKIRFRIFIYIT